MIPLPRTTNVSASSLSPQVLPSPIPLSPISGEINDGSFLPVWPLDANGIVLDTILSESDFDLYVSDGSTDTYIKSYTGATLLTNLSLRLKYNCYIKLKNVCGDPQILRALGHNNPNVGFASIFNVAYHALQAIAPSSGYRWQLMSILASQSYEIYIDETKISGISETDLVQNNLNILLTDSYFISLKSLSGSTVFFVSGDIL
jgi:hypothetical protein